MSTQIMRKRSAAFPSPWLSGLSVLQTPENTHRGSERLAVRHPYRHHTRLGVPRSLGPDAYSQFELEFECTPRISTRKAIRM